MNRQGVDPVEVHDYLLKARAKLLDWARPLTLEQYTQQFPFGLNTLRTTMVEIAGGEWVYTQRLKGTDVPPPTDRPYHPFLQTEFAALERAWHEQVEETKRVLRAIEDWSRSVEYVVRPPNQPAARIRTTTGGIATQMILHEVHHRAQAMAMLRQLGIAAQNLDYSLFAYQRSDVAG